MKKHSKLYNTVTVINYLIFYVSLLYGSWRLNHTATFFVIAGIALVSLFIGEDEIRSKDREAKK